MDNAISVSSTHSDFLKAGMFTKKNRALSSAPTGNPTNRRSKNRDGMMKKASNRKMLKVKSTVVVENKNRMPPSRRGDE